MSARIDTAAERARLDALAGPIEAIVNYEYSTRDSLIHDCALGEISMGQLSDLCKFARVALDEIDRLRAENDKLRADMSGGSFYQEKDIDAMLETVETMRREIEELDFLRHEGGPQSVAAMETLLRETVLPILRRSAEDLFRCVSVLNVPSSVSPSDWRDIAEDMEAVLAVEAFVGRPDDEYGRVLNPILDARMWEAHR